MKAWEIALLIFFAIALGGKAWLLFKLSGAVVDEAFKEEERRLNEKEREPWL